MSLAESKKIFYLGGSPCAGKSSVAEVLISKHHVNYLRLDDRLFDHIQGASEEHQPTLATIRKANCNELWLVPPKIQVKRTINAYIEEFPLHQTDIVATSRPLLIEGAGLLPHLIAPYINSNHHVLFLIPSSDFQRKHYQKRTWVNDVLANCDDKQQAFENWMRRDELYARWIRREAMNYGFKTIIIDGSYDIAQIAEIASQHYGL